MNRPLSSSESVPGASDPRWAAVERRDPRADGSFVYSVRSTGIYCRPSCPARRPRRENVDFHAGPEAAEAAGFRPCKRCRPTETDAVAHAIARACSRLDAAESAPHLADLARDADLSPHHFQRVFKAATGVSPSAYFQARRAERARSALQAGAPVTAAIYESGFNSSGRFYEAAPAMLGMSPTAYRSGGKGERIAFAIAPSALGMVLAAETARGVCAILMDHDADALVADLRKRFPAAEIVPGGAALEARISEVVSLVENPAKACDLPLDIRGTAFQMRVWAALQQIAPGDTAHYSEIADRIGAPGSARAVARACAGNPLAVAIPCHRVIGRNGAMSGYRWGVDRKAALLEKEQAAAKNRKS